MSKRNFYLFLKRREYLPTEENLNPNKPSTTVAEGMCTHETHATGDGLKATWRPPNQMLLIKLIKHTGSLIKQIELN